MNWRRASRSWSKRRGTKEGAAVPGKGKIPRYGRRAFKRR
jgi:hypothetical protein